MENKGHRAERNDHDNVCTLPELLMSECSYNVCCSMTKKQSVTAAVRLNGRAPEEQASLMHQDPTHADAAVLHMYLLMGLTSASFGMAASPSEMGYLACRHARISPRGSTTPGSPLRKHGSKSNSICAAHDCKNPSGCHSILSLIHASSYWLDLPSCTEAGTISHLKLKIAFCILRYAPKVTLVCENHRAKY